MTEDIVKKFQSALDEFVTLHKNNPNVIGILVSGSFIHSKPDKNSDLDISIVMSNSKTRTRGNTWIHGVEIEYFINPVAQIENYFVTEIADKSPCTAHMFANSITLYKKGNQIEKLIKKAKQIMKKKTQKMRKFDIEIEKYHIDDLQKDLEDTFLRKDIFSFNIIAANIFEKSLSIFFRINRIPKEKSKRLRGQLHKIDPDFEKIFTKSLLEVNMTKKFKAILKLIKYIEKLLGGKRPKEWMLTSPCSIKK
jgi:predicted nucleotidyltransferase